MRVRGMVFMGMLPGPSEQERLHLLVMDQPESLRGLSMVSQCLALSDGREVGTESGTSLIIRL